jgi:hypothetical protein
MPVVIACLAACTFSPTGSPAATKPAESEVPDGLALDCQPMELRAPTGEVIDLTGTWAGSGVLVGDDETAWLNQIGDCVFGSVIGGDPVGELVGRESITNLTGRLSADFRIEFDVAILAQADVFQMGEHSTMVVLIEWDDDGRLRLREDRARGATAGRCIQARFDCPDPVIWYRLDNSSL